MLFKRENVRAVDMKREAGDVRRVCRARSRPMKLEQNSLGSAVASYVRTSRFDGPVLLRHAWANGVTLVARASRCLVRLCTVVV